MFVFTQEVRRAIYRTGAIKSLNFSLWKIIENRALFPNNKTVQKILYPICTRHCEKMNNAYTESKHGYEPVNRFGTNSFTQIF